jgi:hypothetical protein
MQSLEMVFSVGTYTYIYRPGKVTNTKMVVNFQETCAHTHTYKNTQYNVEVVNQVFAKSPFFLFRFWILDKIWCACFGLIFILCTPQLCRTMLEFIMHKEK